LWGTWDILRVVLALFLALVVLGAAVCNAYYAYRVYVHRRPSPSPILLLGSVAALLLAAIIPHIHDQARIIVALVGLFVTGGIRILGRLGESLLQMKRNDAPAVSDPGVEESHDD
jgi:hypothetical protein